MISIIVPVYKVEKYLARCFKSIVNQTYKEWELLLIDDGSPDGSGKLCDEYAKKDSRVRVFHKGNGGVSSARNRGIEEANGEWITFIDADDYIAPETLEKCSHFFGNTDMVRFSMRFIYSNDGQQYSDVVLPSISKEGYLSMIVARETIMGVCGGFYRRKMFVDNNILFDESLVSGEDWVVLVQLVMRSNKIHFISAPLYYYNKINESSCTSSFSFKRSYSTLLALYKIEHFFTNYKLNCLEQSISKAKCEIGYDFFSGVLRRNNKVEKRDFNTYASLFSISKREIQRGATSLKRRAFLLFVSSCIGKIIIRWLV